MIIFRANTTYVHYDSIRDAAGNRATADALPTAKIWCAGDLGLTVTVAEESGQTGWYSFTFTTPADISSMLGLPVYIQISATIDTVDAGGGKQIGQFDTKLLSDTLNCNLVTINNDSTVVDKLKANLGELEILTVGAGATTTSIPTDATNTNPNNYVNRSIIILSGDNKGEAVSITGYDGAGTLTVETLTIAPNEGAQVLII